MDEIVATVGAFDGVHLGHRALVEATICHAQRLGCRSVVFTFSQDPSHVLQPQASLRDLLSPADRVSLLKELGASKVVCLPFDEQTAAESYEHFVLETLGSYGSLKALHVGEDFRMGAGGKGTPERLTSLGERLGFELVVEPYTVRLGGRVSSTRIRSLLADGRLDEANELLGREHFVRGHVVHGRGEGTAFGFPTANVEVDPRAQLPQEGVYACYLRMDGHDWPAAVNVGKPRSLSFAGEEGAPFMEANLVGFSGDAYDRDVSVRFVKWLRAPKKFDSLEELEATILGNIAWVRDNLV